MSNKRTFAFYISISLYILFIFFTQWSLSAAKMDAIWLRDILSSTVNYIILPSILALSVYSVVIDFNYYIKCKWFTIISILILFFVAVISKSVSFTLPLLLGFVGFSANNRKVAKIAVLSFSALLMISYIFSTLGLNGGDTISKPLFGVNDVYATSVSAFGLSNPNAVMLIFFNVIALVLFLCKTRRQDFLASVVLLGSTIALSIATGSTTGIVIGFVTLFLVLRVKHSRKLLKVFRKITPVMLLLITILTFVISVNFGNSDNRNNDINNILTGRPHLWNMRIENGSYVNLYGDNDQYQISKSTFSSEPNYALDNLPLYTLVHFGVIMYSIFLFIFYFGSKKIKEPALIAYILAASLLMFMEKMELYGLVLLFLQKTITEHYLLVKKQGRTI